jgi:hypothetical protein
VRSHGGDPTFYDNVRAGEYTAVTPDGNLIVPTGTWFCLVLSGRREGAEEETPLNKRGVFTFHSTAQKVSRRWAGEAHALTATAPNGQVFRPALFAMAWRLGAAPTKNARGSWMLPTVQRERLVSELPHGKEVYRSARAYAELAAEYSRRLTYQFAHIESVR